MRSKNTVYVGVSETGACAVIEGHRYDTRACRGEDDILPIMLILDPKNTRCVVEMKGTGMETATKPMKANEVAYKFCKAIGIPVTAVRKGMWAGDMLKNADTKLIYETAISRAKRETRDGKISAEAEALLLAEYAKATFKERNE